MDAGGDGVAIDADNLVPDLRGGEQRRGGKVTTRRGGYRTLHYQAHNSTAPELFQMEVIDFFRFFLWTRQASHAAASINPTHLIACSVERAIPSQSEMIWDGL